MATHTRQTSHSKRPLPAHARPSKPAPLFKRTNSHGASKKAVPLHKKEEVFEEEDLMATSFLQFCTTCEKQIIVPCNSVLYCSQSCRKKDTEKQFTFPPDQSPPLTPFSQFSNFSFEDLHFRDIVPPRSPTQVRSNRSSCAFSELSSDDNAGSGDEKSRQESDASRYLRHFRQPSYSNDLTATIRPRRPQYNRASTSHVNFSAAPSLSHTPASSVSYSLPYTPSTRPLPPRTPHSSSYTNKSIDLVTPLTYASTAPSSPKQQYSLKTLAQTATSASTIEGEITYAKSPIMSISPANGSLGRLLASSPH